MFAKVDDHLKKSLSRGFFVIRKTNARKVHYKYFMLAHFAVFDMLRVVRETMHKEINRKEGNMEYTLYYQLASGRSIAVATSDSLLKLCKIKYMTFHGRKGFPFIVKSADGPSADSFNYGAGCLFGSIYDELIRFMNNVDAGKYYASYDYRQRVRDRYLAEEAAK